MNYYLDKKTNEIYAYDEQQLATVDLINKLEAAMQEYDDEQIATVDLINELEAAMQEDDSEELRAQYNAIDPIFFTIRDNIKELRAQYDAIDPIFFTIRDNINEFTEVSDEEVAEILRKKQEEYEKTDEYQALLREQQKTQKTQLLSDVKEEIEILQDAIDFDEHEEGDEDYLIALKKYRVQLNKVDTDIAPCEFPIKPQK